MTTINMCPQGHTRMALLLGMIIGILIGCGSVAKMSKSLDNISIQERRFEIGSISYGAQQVPQGFADRFKNNLENEMKSRGLMAAGQAKYRLDINVQELHVRGLSRVMGVLAGKDRIKSVVTVTNLASREVAAQGEIESHSIAPVDDMAVMHPAAIAKLLAGNP